MTITREQKIEWLNERSCAGTYGHTTAPIARAILADYEPQPRQSDIRWLAPTPWRVEDDPNHTHWTNSISIFDADGGEIAVFTRGYEGDENGDGCESFANAMMCAAAPALLAALELFFKWFKNSGSSVSARWDRVPTEERRVIVEEAHAAITAARGAK